MTNVLIADAQPEVRLALRLLLLDIEMKVVGEAADWPMTLKTAANTQPDMVVIDWELISTHHLLDELRATCSDPVVIVLVGSLSSRQQSAFSVGADNFVSKHEAPDRFADRLKAAATKVQS